MPFVDGQYIQPVYLVIHFGTQMEIDKYLDKGTSSQDRMAIYQVVHDRLVNTPGHKVTEVRSNSGTMKKRK